MNNLVFAALSVSIASSNFAPPTLGDSALRSGPALATTVVITPIFGVRPTRAPVQDVKPGVTHGRWGGMVKGKWAAGWKAPGGWAAYRRPFRGFVLPRYWTNPGFYVVNYPVYGLSRPSAGYNWYRYYDDAVLADGYGRVYDSVSGISWGDHDAERAMAYDHQAAEAQGAAPSTRYDESAYRWDEGVNDDAADDGEEGIYEGRWNGEYIDREGRVYKGRWDGTYTDREGRVYRGSYQGMMTGDPRYQADAGPGDDRHAGVGYPPRHHDAPSGYGWQGQTVYGYPGAYGYPAYAPGHAAYHPGYYYPAPQTTTIVIQPGYSTTTSYVVEEPVRRATRARKVIKRSVRKPACQCK